MKKCKNWHQRNPEKARELARKWYKENAEKSKADHRRRYANQPLEKRQNKYLQKTYGITLEQYYSIIEEQNGLCAICEEPLGKPIERAHSVDHDHSSSGPGSVRGVVHAKCNLILGHVEKNRDLFPKIADYLRRHAQKKRDEAFKAQELANQINDLSKIIQEEE